MSESVRESVSITVDNNNTKHICRFGAVLGFKLYVSKLIFMVEMKLHVITIAHCNCILPEEDDDDHHHQDDVDGDANGCRAIVEFLWNILLLFYIFMAKVLDAAYYSISAFSCRCWVFMSRAYLRYQFEMSYSEEIKLHKILHQPYF